MAKGGKFIKHSEVDTESLEYFVESAKKWNDAIDVMNENHEGIREDFYRMWEFIDERDQVLRLILGFAVGAFFAALVAVYLSTNC